MKDIINNEMPLYKTKDKEIYYRDFINALKELGIQRGDTLFIHSDISSFGKLCVFKRKTLLQVLIDILKESVGAEGTIVMPTFTYSFCKNEVFDLHNTRSTVGAITEFFRKQPDVKRTIHPIFSTAIWGKYQEELIDISKDSFDENSVFGKLHRLKGKILFFGAPFQSCTFIHCIEQAYGVPYRYMKKFKGIIRKKYNEYHDEYSYLVRDLERNSILNTTKLLRYLKNNRIIKEKKLGYGYISVIEADILFSEGMKLLDKDIYFFLNKSK